MKGKIIYIPNPDNINPNPGTHMVKERANFSKLPFDLHSPWHTYCLLH